MAINGLRYTTIHPYRRLVFTYEWDLGGRVWLHPFKYYWHFTRRGQWGLTRYQNEHGYVGTWNLNFGPGYLTRIIDLKRSDPHPLDLWEKL